MSKRNEWRYMFVRYEINYSTKEECIYINGDLYKKRAIHGGILGFFQSDFLLGFINLLGGQGWELQSELGTSELRNLTFKQLVVERDEDEEDEDYEEDEDLTQQNIDKEEFNRDLKKLNNKLHRFKTKTIYTLSAMQQSLVEIQDKLERISQDELISTKGINYRYLHNLLSIGNWQIKRLLGF